LWYRRAAAQGVVQAMVNLGMLYERGEGVLVSQVDAYAWYLAAGRRGNQPAARRAEDLFGALSQLDQIRAQVLARDVASSIHDPAPATPSGG
jgi:TPR repeat protein